VVVLSVSDVLHSTLQFVVSQTPPSAVISSDVLGILAELAFTFFRPTQPRLLDLAIANIFNQNIAETWAEILGWISSAVYACALTLFCLFSLSCVFSPLSLSLSFR
jgi:hypothetical protein